MDAPVHSRCQGVPRLHRLEAINRARGITPDLTTYLRMRSLTSGLWIDTEFIEIAERVHLPPEVRNHSVVRTLTCAANNIVCWANDIISLDKEVKRGDIHNLVLARAPGRARSASI